MEDKPRKIKESNPKNGTCPVFEIDLHKILSSGGLYKNGNIKSAAESMSKKRIFVDAMRNMS
jgi:hypothetical protein